MGPILPLVQRLPAQENPGLIYCSGLCEYVPRSLFTLSTLIVSELNNNVVYSFKNYFTLAVHSYVVIWRAIIVTR